MAVARRSTPRFPAQPTGARPPSAAALDPDPLMPAPQVHSPPASAPQPVPALRLVDSVAELTASDTGCIAITASHGGLSAGRYALAVRPALTVFNDAGVGLAQAGIAALPMLDEAGLAACTVAHTSACIGQAQSTWATGLISHANTAALALGLNPGHPLQAQVAGWLQRQCQAGT
jgi:hypothetical protein